MFIRTASAHDVDAIRSLIAETWHDALDGLLGADGVAALMAEWQGEAVLREALDRPGGEFVVADDGASLAGAGFASAAGEGKLLTVDQLCVRPTMQRRGIGGLLLDELLNAFPDADLCRLEVVRGNDRAVAFFESFGFSIVGEQDARPPRLVLERHLGEGAP